MKKLTIGILAIFLLSTMTFSVSAIEKETGCYCPSQQELDERYLQDGDLIENGLFLGENAKISPAIGTIFSYIGTLSNPFQSVFTKEIGFISPIDGWVRMGPNWIRSSKAFVFNNPRGIRWDDGARTIEVGSINTPANVTYTRIVHLISENGTKKELMLSNDGEIIWR